MVGTRGGALIREVSSFHSVLYREVTLIFLLLRCTLHVSFLLSGCTVPHLLPPLTAQDADEQAKAVTARSEKIAVEEARCKELADAAQHDLDEALPALEEAVKVCCRCYVPVTAAVRSPLCGG